MLMGIARQRRFSATLLLFPFKRSLFALKSRHIFNLVVFKSLSFRLSLSFLPLQRCRDSLRTPGRRHRVVGSHLGPQGLGHSLALADARGLQAVELWLGRWCNWVLGTEI